MFLRGGIMATRRLLQAAGRRLRAGARSASDDARIVQRATRGQVEMRQFGIESLGGAGMHAPHVAIFGAGFVGVNTALALLQRNIASRVTLTDVDKEKCFNYAEAQKYDATADTLEHMCAQLPPVGFSRTDALDAGAARKEAYEEAA